METPIINGMLNQIRASDATFTKGPVALLLGCHERIRYFTRMALRFAKFPDAAVQEVTSAAEALVRYFSIALPLHEADENESIFPRLHGAVPAGHIVFESVEAMLSQHRAINELLQKMIPLWQTIQSQPVELPHLAAELTALANRLRLQFDAHLAMEEEIIFPAMEKLLPSTELEQIETEIYARRKAAA